MDHEVILVFGNDIETLGDCIVEDEVSEALLVEDELATHFNRANLIF